MKKIKLVFLVLLFLGIPVLAGCSKKEAASKAVNPDASYVRVALESIEGISDIQMISEEEDPYDLMGKEGGYKALISFTIDEVDDRMKFGNTSLDRNVVGGGMVEIYEKRSDASGRNLYLSAFDASSLSSGSHEVVGSCLVRVTNSLTDIKQSEYMKEIEKALLGEETEQQ